MSAHIELPLKQFTVDEYHYFIAQGVFAPDERLELLDGKFIAMSPIGKRHAGCVAALANYLKETLERRALVWVQNPVVLDDYSEPQPDICLLNWREDFYRQTSATAQDALLVIEVADSTARYDREAKFPRYAQAGIAEAWLIDLEHDRVEIHSQPSAEGYCLLQILHRGQTAQSNVLPDVKIEVAEILG